MLYSPVYLLVFNVLAKSLLFDGPLKVIWFTVAIAHLLYYYLFHVADFLYHSTVYNMDVMFREDGIEPSLNADIIFHESNFIRRHTSIWQYQMEWNSIIYFLL